MTIRLIIIIIVAMFGIWFASASAQTIEPGMNAIAAPASSPVSTTAAPTPLPSTPRPALPPPKRVNAISSASAERIAPTPEPTSSEAMGSRTADVVRIALVLGLMAVIPAMMICMTSFIRIIVVLSMIRHAFGMPETPPNQVLISLALFLTAFSMMPTLEAVNNRALQPFLGGELSIQGAIDEGTDPAREFMLRQVRDQDIKAIYDIARMPLPARAQDVGLMQLIPAFMLNELRVAFRIGLVVLLPFLLIDLVVSSILLALGMLMVPPSTLSLPIKVLMFVLIDGWSLVLQGVLGSFR